MGLFRKNLTWQRALISLVDRHFDLTTKVKALHRSRCASRLQNFTVESEIPRGSTYGADNIQSDAIPRCVPVLKPERGVAEAENPGNRKHWRARYFVAGTC